MVLQSLQKWKSPVTVSYSNWAMYGGFSSGKTKTPGRKNFLLSVLMSIKQDWNDQIRSNSDRRSGTSKIRSCSHQNLSFTSGPEGRKMRSNAFLTFSHFKKFPSKFNYWGPKKGGSLSINYFSSVRIRQNSRKQIKKFWVKKEPGNGVFPGFFACWLVSISACWTAVHDVQLWDRT